MTTPITPACPGITTERLAELVGVTPGTIRSHLCRRGSYYGLRPRKMPNRMLRWPADSMERLLAKTGTEEAA